MLPLTEFLFAHGLVVTIQQLPFSPYSARMYDLSFHFFSSSTYTNSPILSARYYCSYQQLLQRRHSPLYLAKLFIHTIFQTTILSIAHSTLLHFRFIHTPIIIQMCELEDVYHSCGHWGPQRFINEPCIRSRTTVSGHTLPCDYKETNGMANSKDLCSSCKRASLASSNTIPEFPEPLLPPPLAPSSRSGSVSSAISESIVESAESMESVGSVGSERPVIRIKSLSAGKIHWVSSMGEVLNWFWFGRRKESEANILGCR